MRNLSCAYKRIILFVLLHFLFTNVKGQQPILKFDYLSVNDKLSSNYITKLYKDSKGYVWIGTNTGLNKYNAYTIKNYFQIEGDSSSLPNENISAFYEDSDKKLWIGTNDGLCIYNHSSDNFQQIDLFGNMQGHHKIISSIVETQDDLLLIGTNYGLYRINKRNGISELELGPESELSSTAISALYLKDNDKLFIGSNARYIDVYNTKNKEIKHIPVEGSEDFDPAINTVVRFLSDSDQSFWMVIYGIGLFKYDSLNNNFKKVPVEIGNNKKPIIHDFLEYDDTHFFLFFNPGLVLYNRTNGTFSYITKQENVHNSLNSNALHIGYKDNNNTIWIGTSNAGVNIYKPNKFRFQMLDIRYNDKQMHSSVLGLHLFNGKKLLIATNGDGIYTYDLGKKSILHYTKENSGLKSDVVNSILIDKKGNYWFGTYMEGLNIVSNDFKALDAYKTTIDKINRKTISCIVEAGDSIIFIGSLNEGLVKYNVHTRKTKHYVKHKNKNSISDNYIFDMMLDENTLWIATAGGGVNAFNIKTEEFKAYTADNFRRNILASHKVYCIYKDADQRIWFGTNRGISLYQEHIDGFITFSRKHGLGDNNVKSICEDDNGVLWLSNNIGIDRFQYTGNDSVSIKSFDLKDGIECGSFEMNSCCKLPDGRLLFGGVNGVCIFNPTDFNQDTSQGRVILSGLKIQNQSINMLDSINGRVLLENDISETKELVFQYKEKALTFEFALLHYTNPENNVYACFLEGYDDHWNYIEPGQRTVIYTNLKEGKYTLRAKAANHDGYWSENELMVHIVILPPWYRTWWAYIMYLIAGFLVFVLLRYTLFLKIRFKQMQILTKKERELDEAKLRFFMNISHEFRAPLTLILAPLNDLMQTRFDPYVKRKHELIYRNARRLKILINQLLDLQKTETGKYELAVQKSNIITFLESIFNAFRDLAERHNITYRFQSDPASLICDFDKDIIDKVMYNILSNAFKFTPDGGNVSVKINEHSDKNSSRILEIKISDTGIGIPKEKITRVFDRFYRIETDNVRTNSGTGIGLALSKELIEVHNGRISVESEVNKGSVFTVQIPILNELVVEDRLHEEHLETSVQVLPDYQQEEIAEEKIKGKTDEKNGHVYIIDDNPDLKNYLADQLQAEFEVSTFKNGKEGYEKAIAEIPDIIISDVMMPVMDGFTLCSKIKTNTCTSHIPVILLTAKSSDKDQLAGLETGADDYVLKPFSFPVLKARIDAILLNRQKIWDKLKSDKFISPDILIKGKQDKEFVKKVVEIIHKHIGNPDLDYKIISQEIGMSKTLLYRKISSLTDNSVHEFIKITRMKKSAELLKDTNYTVTDVAYMVGFKYLPNFSSTFKTYFKLSPKEFIEKNGQGSEK